MSSSEQQDKDRNDTTGSAPKDWFEGHNSIVEIDTAAFANNVEAVRGKLDRGTRIMAVVKSNAYGHGAVPAARFLEKRVDAFAVADIREALQLRNAGIRLPILVLGVPTEATAPLYRKHEIIAVVSDFNHFELLPEGTRYHLKFDTGMGRFGFLPEQLDEVRQRISHGTGIECQGVMTHCSTTDDPHSDHAARQLRIFRQLIGSFPDTLTFHAANSGGVLNYRDSHLDMVRPGICLYGYGPANESMGGFQRVMTWKSAIAQAKKIRQGAPISYGMRWSAPTDGYLAVIPVGYDDGLYRRLSHKIQFLINGQTYPAVGTITMNNVMVYLGDDYHEAGTNVTIMGAEENAADRWADAIGSIAYEILVGVHSGVRRVYL